MQPLYQYTTFRRSYEPSSYGLPSLRHDRLLTGLLFVIHNELLCHIFGLFFKFALLVLTDHDVGQCDGGGRGGSLVLSLVDDFTVLPPASMKLLIPSLVITNAIC